MKSLNKVQLMGNLTKDPETRTTPNGQSVTSFTLATNRTWTDNQGVKQEVAEFTDVVAWGKLGEIISQYAKKGKPVYIEGRLQTRNWEAQDGSKRYKTEVIAQDLILLGGAPGEVGAPAATREAAAVTDGGGSMPSQAPADDEINIDDIPF